VALKAEEEGLEVMLHLPLEPEDPKLPLGPGGVTTAMNADQIAQTVAADLDQVPGAIGINNHEGSKATADERVMRAVLEIIKSRGLFFVDSVTSPRTIAGRLAAQMQIPTASRAVFLDNQDQAEAIRTQMRELITVALQRKQAIAIGHTMRMTPQVLQEMLGEFDRQDIELVPVSTLVH
ncbi:MAG TPA: divergent polysaccharide deacetylase family protein, partial [bacterium]|nr:divergent polysaccharide deacetylase family protein [bacterium]